MQKTSSKKKAFPSMSRIRQRTSAHCGPAVLQMLLSFLDISIDQDVFVEVTGVAHKLMSHGMTVAELGEAIKRVVPQVQFWYKRKASFEDISTIVTIYKHPVGVEWQGIFGRFGDEDDGHYGVVTAINLIAETITIADPFWKFIKKDRKFTLAKFSTRWWDLNEVVSRKTGRLRHVKDERMLFIITSKEARFPKTLGLRKV